MNPLERAYEIRLKSSVGRMWRERICAHSPKMDERDEDDNFDLLAAPAGR